MKNILCAIGLHKFPKKGKVILKSVATSNESALGSRFTSSTTTTHYEAECSRCSQKKLYSVVQHTESLKK